MQHHLAGTVDCHRWVQRWEDRQVSHNPRRETRFRVMLEIAASLLGDRPGRILDLGAGLGSLAMRVVRRFPSAQVTALDVDPLLLALGAGAHGRAGGRLRWVQADLRVDWTVPLEHHGPFDAVMASSALSWLTPDELATVYRRAATLLRPGGVLLNADEMQLAVPAAIGSALQRTHAQLTNLTRLMEGCRPARPCSDSNSCRYWWAEAASEPAFARLMADRDAIFEARPSAENYISTRQHRRALRDGGFHDVVVVWRNFDDTIILGVR